jgi:hypothetical protein
MGNFLYPWARNKFLTQQPATLSWNSSSVYKVMFINAGVGTNYIWSGSGISGYAWNPVSGTDDGTNPGVAPAGAGYAITWLSQVPTAHRSISASYGGIAGIANTLGIIATNYGNGVANASAASTTQLAVAAGAAITAFVIYRDPTGINATAANASSYIYESAMDLIAFFDSAIGMPVSGNGGDITIVWDTSANKIFKL